MRNCFNKYDGIVGCRYGGGPTLARKVISSGLSKTELAVEVYPLRLQLLIMPKGDHSTIRISKKVLLEICHDSPLSYFVHCKIHRISMLSHIFKKKNQFFEFQY